MRLAKRMGAGSGKTRMLTVRIAWLLEREGVPPGSILALVLTGLTAWLLRRRDKHWAVLSARWESSPTICKMRSRTDNRTAQQSSPIARIRPVRFPKPHRSSMDAVDIDEPRFKSNENITEPSI